MADKVITNINVFVDGRGQSGQVEEMTPPTLALQTEAFRAGGMDTSTEIDMGMEPLKASFVMKKYAPEILKLFGFISGGSVPLTLRGGAQNDDGSVDAVVMKMRGKITSLDRGSWKPGATASMTVSVDLEFYQETVAGEEVALIDVKNMIRKIGGVDQMAEMRKALGR